MSALKIIILTGQSGSGKSTALRALEDQGYLCVDNVPASIVDKLLTTVRDDSATSKLALVLDARQPHLTTEVPELISRVRAAKLDMRLVYFESREEALIRRYSETRRKHPLDHGEGLRAAISHEHNLLAPLRELADETVDTSDLSPHELRDGVTAKLAGASLGDDLRIAIMSFGFKYGVPPEADMMLDVRFLTNPYFVQGLKTLTGRDQPVKDFVMASDDTAPFIERTDSLLQFLVPKYQREGKRYLTIAIGCTGGRHRSVAISEALAGLFQQRGVSTDVRHRDIMEDTR